MDTPEDPKKDSALWHAAMKDVTPLRKDSPTTPKPVPQTPRVRTRREESPAPPLPIARDNILASTFHHTGLDTRTDEKLRKGQMPIEAALDLHGLSQERAYVALHDFILRSHQNDLRCVLIITGKGSRDPLCSGKGVLKQKVPEWLLQEPLRTCILQTHPARQNHGGGGALYVLLRRKRL